MLLEGVRIVSLCHYLQGPAAAQYLADMGADVIKVEPIGGAYERRWSGANVFVEGVSGFYLCANRNKRSISINLKSDAGREIFHKLVATADVVMENFRPGTLDRLGLGFEVLKGVREDLIFASASGFGADGPYRDLPGQDLLIQARAGLVSATAGQRKGVLPAAAGCAAVDQHGAALFALGIAGALIRRQRTGEGTRVESSLFNAGIDLQQEALANYLNGAKEPEVFDRDPHLATWFHEAPYGIYETADGKHLALSLNALDLLDEAFRTAGLKDDPVAGPADEAPLDSYRDRDRVAEKVAKKLLQLTRDEAEAALSEHKIWYAPVQNYSDLATDPQARHNNVFGSVSINGAEATLINHPNRYNGHVPPTRHMALQAGQDSKEVLAEIGIGEDTIASLLESNDIG